MSVFGLLSGVAGFVKVRYLIDKAIIDNMIFRCHYRITSALLFVGCIVVTANNLIGKLIIYAFCLTSNKNNSVLTKLFRIILFPGDPIACINDGAVPNHVINTYCWITYTFTLPGQHGKHFVLVIYLFGVKIVHSCAYTSLFDVE